VGRRQVENLCEGKSDTLKRGGGGVGGGGGGGGGWGGGEGGCVGGGGWVDVYRARMLEKKREKKEQRKELFRGEKGDLFRKASGAKSRNSREKREGGVSYGKGEKKTWVPDRKEEGGGPRLLRGGYK